MPAALARVEEEMGELFWERVFRMAWDDSRLLAVVLDKLVPDRHPIEARSASESILAETREARQRLREGE
jgi:hypothetical protein